MSRLFDASRIKVATFDLDGTVLDQGRLSEKVELALKSLSDKGVAVAVATGRDISQIPKKVLGLFKYRITNNGSQISDSSGRAIFDSPIPMDVAVETLDILHKFKGHSSLYLNGKVVATPPFLLRILARTDFASKSNRSTTKEARKGNSHVRFSLARFLRKKGLVPYKIQTFFRNAEDTKTAIDKLLSLGKVNPIQSMEICLETVSSGTSKANALLRLCKSLGYSCENAISFGDSGNDLDIIRAAGYSVAMGNAEQCVKDEADYVTESVAEDGVALAIEDLFNL